jgi:hypothetical protein
MVLDIELTLNRWGLYRPAGNKLQIGPLRFAWWTHLPKVALSFEVNWQRTLFPKEDD